MTNQKRLKIRSIRMGTKLKETVTFYKTKKIQKKINLFSV